MTTWWKLAELSVNRKPSAAANTISAAGLERKRGPRTLDNLRRRNAKRISSISSNGGRKCSPVLPTRGVESRADRTARARALTADSVRERRPNETPSAGARRTDDLKKPRRRTRPSGSADPWSRITSRPNRTRARTDGGQCARATPERNTLGGGETNRRLT
jgi:hypothetical protein